MSPLKKLEQVRIFRTRIFKAFSMQYDGKTFEFRINGMSSLLLFLENVLFYSRHWVNSYKISLIFKKS